MINRQNRFDGCRRACRTAQKHTKIPGDCLAATAPRIVTADAVMRPGEPKDARH